MRQRSIFVAIIRSRSRWREKMPMELFPSEPTHHKGASPWQRYKSAKGGVWPARIGWLTFEVDDALMSRLCRFAERDDWRRKIVEAIDGLCRG